MELVRFKVDIIVAVVTQASLAAKKATPTIPIVMIGVADPRALEDTWSRLARPGANITGTSSMTAEIVGKQLELLKETLPKISRVAGALNRPIQSFRPSSEKRPKTRHGHWVSSFRSRKREDLRRSTAPSYRWRGAHPSAYYL